MLIAESNSALKSTTMPNPTNDMIAPFHSGTFIHKPNNEPEQAIKTDTKK